MPDVLPGLIDKQDTFEVVRDQVALIIAENQLAQQALASSQGKPDPTLWALEVFIEASDPWEERLHSPGDHTPLVNVWYESGFFDMGKGDTVERQAHAATVNVDIYGFAVAQDDPQDPAGHLPADRDAALNAQRGLRLVRNILMASENTYLQLRGAVWSRWPTSIASFQPDLGEDKDALAGQVLGVRLALAVEFNEFAPQYEGLPFDLLNIDVHRAVDGKLILEADYDYT